jgi:hypothetical protein
MFEPIYESKFIEPIIVNLEDYLRNSEVEAFMWSNDGDALDTTAVWRRSRWFNTLFPVTSIIAVRTIPAVSEDKSYMEETNTVTVEIEIQGNNPDDLAMKVMRRIKAYDAAIRKSRLQDIFAGFDFSRTGDFWLDIGQHDYASFIRNDQTIYKQTGSFNVTVHVMQVAEGYVT